MTADTISAVHLPSEAVGSIQVLPTLREWETRSFRGVRLSSADRALVERLGDAGEGRLQIDELRDGLRVRARSWIGVVRLETVEIRIVPKLAGDHLGLVRLLEFTSGLEGLWRFETDSLVEVAGDSLLDLVALLFAEATEGVVRRGLMAGYIEREEALGVVRGRILPDRQMLQRFGQLDRIICRFDELEHDIDENRLLVAALRAAARRVITPSVHRRLGRLRAVLEPVCDPTGLDLRMLRREITYNRLNAHYEQAHGLAWFVLRALGINDLLDPGSTRSFAFLLDMNLLFERFVERLVGRVLDSRLYQVDAQVAHSSIIWDETTQRPYSRVRPDLVVRRRGTVDHRLAIDAKYKLYDDRRVAPSDIYQTFLYAYALSSRGTGASPTALLLYPASSSERRPIRLKVRSLHTRQGADIVGMGIPIPDALNELQCNEDGPVRSALRDEINGALHANNEV